MLTHIKRYVMYEGESCFNTFMMFLWLRYSTGKTENNPTFHSSIPETFPVKEAMRASLSRLVHLSLFLNDESQAGVIKDIPTYSR